VNPAGTGLPAGAAGAVPPDPGVGVVVSVVVGVLAGALVPEEVTVWVTVACVEPPQPATARMPATAIRGGGIELTVRGSQHLHGARTRV
jgi:hypothetical protein